MEHATTYVGIDAHKKDLYMALVVGDQATPTAWTTPNEPRAVRRLPKKFEREALAWSACFTRPGPVATRCSGN